MLSNDLRGTDFNSFYTAYLQNRNRNPIGVGKKKNDNPMRHSAPSAPEFAKINSLSNSNKNFFDSILQGGSPANLLKMHNITKTALNTIWTEFCNQIRSFIIDDKTVCINGIGFFATVKTTYDKSVIRRTPVFLLAETYQNRYGIKYAKQPNHTGKGMINLPSQTTGSNFSKEVVNDSISEIFKCLGMFAQGIFGNGRTSVDFVGICTLYLSHSILSIEWNSEFLKDIETRDKKNAPAKLSNAIAMKGAEKNKKILNDLGLSHNMKESIQRHNPYERPPSSHGLRINTDRSPSPKPPRSPKKLNTVVKPVIENHSLLSVKGQTAHRLPSPTHNKNPLPPLSPTSSELSVAAMRKVHNSPENLRKSWHSQLSDQEHQKVLERTVEQREREAQDETLKHALFNDYRRKNIDREMMKNEWLSTVSDKERSKQQDFRRTVDKNRNENLGYYEPYVDYVSRWQTDKKLSQEQYRAHLGGQVLESIESLKRPKTPKRHHDPLEDRKLERSEKMRKQKRQADDLKKQIEEKQERESKMNNGFSEQLYIAGRDDELTRKSKDLALSIGQHLKEEVSEREKLRRSCVEQENSNSVQRTIDLLNFREQQISQQLQERKHQSEQLRNYLTQQQQDQRIRKTMSYDSIPN
jgi:hypothetical protein